jgi:long-chain acyl-CoA synthetase
LATSFHRQALLTNLVVKYVKRMVPRWRIRKAIAFNALLQPGRALTPDETTIGHDDIAFLQYTGGTTGVAKGAVLTHGNMVANCSR